MVFRKLNKKLVFILLVFLGLMAFFAFLFFQRKKKAEECQLREIFLASEFESSFFEIKITNKLNLCHHLQKLNFWDNQNIWAGGEGVGVKKLLIKFTDDYNKDLITRNLVFSLDSSFKIPDRGTGAVFDQQTGALTIFVFINREIFNLHSEDRLGFYFEGVLLEDLFERTNRDKYQTVDFEGKKVIDQKFGEDKLAFVKKSLQEKKSFLLINKKNENN